jgi:hypothetical protein
VGVWLLVALLLSEVLPVLEALAPDVSELVGDAVVVGLALTVVLAVMDAVPVPLCVGEPVAVPEGVWLLVTLLLSEVLPVFDTLAPSVSELVGDAEMVGRPLNVEEGVGGGAPGPPLAEGVPEPLPVGVCAGVAVALELLLLEAEAPAEGLGMGKAEGGAVGVPARVPQPALEADALPVPVASPLGEALPASLPPPPVARAVANTLCGAAGAAEVEPVGGCKGAPAALAVPPLPPPTLPLAEGEPSPEAD